jgi:hypothetical protein
VAALKADVGGSQLWQALIDPKQTVKEKLPQDGIGCATRGGIEPPTQGFVIHQFHQIEINDCENWGLNTNLIFKS